MAKHSKRRKVSFIEKFIYGVASLMIGLLVLGYVLCEYGGLWFN